MANENLEQDSAGPTRPGGLAASLSVLTAMVLAGVLVGAAAIMGFVGAFHAPQAHSLGIAVQTPPVTYNAIKGAAATAYGDAFKLQSVPSQKEGDQLLRTRKVYGELVVLNSKTWVFKYAAPNGTQVNGVLAATFRPSNTAIDYSTSSLIPAPTGDVTGLAVFFMTFACVLVGFLMGLVLTLGAAEESLVRRFLALLVASAITGVLSIVLVAGAFHSLPGSGVAIVLQGLLVFSVGAFTMLLGKLWRLWGLGLAALIMVVLGMVTSVSLFPPPYLTGTLRPFSALLPPGQAAFATTGHAYFSNDTFGRGLIGLILWSLLAVAVTFAVVQWRERAPRPAAVDAVDLDDAAADDKIAADADADDDADSDKADAELDD